jgi:hypothetical protein
MGMFEPFVCEGLTMQRNWSSKFVHWKCTKQFIIAIGSSKVEHVERLIKTSIAQNCGIRKCLELLDKVAQQVYRTRNYTEEDELRGLLLWRLGGA